jgi:5'-3' exonuclease
MTIMGDDSDNIDGYRGMGKVKTQKFFEKYESIENFLESPDTHPTMDKEVLRKLVHRNELLMNLKGYYNRYGKELKVLFYKGIKDPKVDKERFLKICRQFGMNKMMSSGFINQFKQLRNA